MRPRAVCDVSHVARGSHVDYSCSKGKSKSKDVAVHAMKEYHATAIQIHLILPLAVDGGYLLGTRLCTCLTPHP
jgi:hypothetical protein